MSFIGQTSPSGNNVLIEDNGVFATILHIKSGLYFYVSSIDVDYVLQYGWTIDSGFGRKTYLYVSRTNNGKIEYLHRYIMSQYCDLSNLELKVDHIDRNPSNNTRENLRLVSHRLNNLNKLETENSKSKIFGVNPISENCFSAELRVHRKIISLGIFSNKYDAGLVRDSYIYHNLPESEWDAMNIRNGKIPDEILEKYNIDPNDPSTIPFIPSYKCGKSEFNGVSFCESAEAWRAFIRNNNGIQQNIKQSNSEIEAADAREQYLLDHPELNKKYKTNRSNIIWPEAEDGKEIIAGVILTKDEYEEKTRGY